MKGRFWILQVTGIGVSVLATYGVVTIFSKYIPMVSFVLKGGTILVLVLLVWAHEMGHRVAYSRFGIPVVGPVLFLPLGGFTIPGKSPNAYAKYLSGVMGPATGLIAIPLVLGAWITGNNWLAWYALLIASINVLNFLPIYPLDGGHILTSLLMDRVKNAGKWVALGSIILVLALASLNPLVLVPVLVLVGFMWLLDAALTFLLTRWLKRDEEPSLGRISARKLVPYTAGYLGFLITLSAVSYWSFCLLQP